MPKIPTDPYASRGDAVRAARAAGFDVSNWREDDAITAHADGHSWLLMPYDGAWYWGTWGKGTWGDPLTGGTP